VDTVGSSLFAASTTFFWLATTISPPQLIRLTDIRDHRMVGNECLQLHGGYGYLRKYPISSASADARFPRLAVQRFSDPRSILSSWLGL
jgi:hypothetical protein